MASPSRSIDSELKPENVNPLFEKETSPEIKLGKMRAREIWLQLAQFYSMF